jgi:hypothetical protein
MTTAQHDGAITQPGFNGTEELQHDQQPNRSKGLSRKETQDQKRKDHKTQGEHRRRGRLEEDPHRTSSPSCTEEDKERNSASERDKTPFAHDHKVTQSGARGQEPQSRTAAQRQTRTPRSEKRTEPRRNSRCAASPDTGKDRRRTSAIAPDPQLCTQCTAARPTFMVSRAFYSLVMATFPGLAKNWRYRWLFLEAVVGLHRDEDTGNPVVSWYHLATIEGKAHEIRSKTYQGMAFIRRYWRDTGHIFTLSRHSYWRQKARTVKDDGLPAQLARALEIELCNAPVDPVDFVTGRVIDRRRAAAARQTDLARATARCSDYPESQTLSDYMNRLPRQPFSTAMKRHGTAGIAVALAEPNPHKRRHALVTLRAMLSQPQQFVGPSWRDRSRRVFPLHMGYGTLPREVAAVIGQEWFEADLVSSQLTIAAYTWHIPEVIAFLEAGQSIWDTLALALGTTLVMKPAIKKALYSLLYGAQRWTIARQLQPIANERRISTVKLGELFLTHPLISRLYAAREQQLQRIRKAGGAYDCYGKWVSVYEAEERHGRRRRNPRSVLAILAQAVEFKLLVPVLRIATTSQDFYITQWAHDGFCLAFVDQRRADSVIKRIEAGIAAEAAMMGIRMKLEWKRDPRKVSLCEETPPHSEESERSLRYDRCI